jgi:hypothetical protein
MPGFNIEGAWAEGPSNVQELRRKHRWTFTIAAVDAADQNRATLYLQKATRPMVKFEEVEMHHDQERAYYAGRTEWDPITLEFYDAEQPIDTSNFVYEWVNRVSDIMAVTVAEPGGGDGYKKDSTLEMYNGVGEVNEAWTMFGCWPQETNWNDLDYSVSDIAMCTVKMRFDRAFRGSI